MALRKKGRRKFGDGGSNDDWALTDPPPRDALVRAGIAPSDKPYPTSDTMYQSATKPYPGSEQYPIPGKPMPPDQSGVYPPAHPHYYEGELVFPVVQPASPQPPMFYKWGWGRGSEPDVAQHEKLQQAQEDWARWKILQQQQEAGMPRYLQRNADMAKPPQPPPSPQRDTSFSHARRSSSPSSADLEVRPRDPTLKSDLDYWRIKKSKAQGGALRFQEGDLVDENLTPDSWYGDSGGISDVNEPQLQRPASETAERERLRNLQFNPPEPTPPNPAPNLAGQLQAAENKYGLPQGSLWQYGTDPRNPYRSIDGAGRYLAQTQAYVPRMRQNMAKAPPSRTTPKISSALSSLGAGTQGTQAPQAQPVELPKASLPTETQPMNQKDYSDRLKSIMDMIGLSGWAKGGEVHGDAAQDREQMLGILREKKLIKKRGGRAEFAKGGLPDLPEPPEKIPGKDVLHRAPLGHALLPVLHTTIVIGLAPKKGRKKGENKAEGGRLETAPNFPDTPPRRPHAIPPRRGKTPRGVGRALRGWGKTGR